MTDKEIREINVRLPAHINVADYKEAMNKVIDICQEDVWSWKEIGEATPGDYGAGFRKAIQYIVDGLEKKKL